MNKADCHYIVVYVMNKADCHYTVVYVMLH